LTLFFGKFVRSVLSAGGTVVPPATAGTQATARTPATTRITALEWLLEKSETSTAAMIAAMIEMPSTAGSPPTALSQEQEGHLQQQ